jgi:O-antigen ligase
MLAARQLTSAQTQKTIWVGGTVLGLGIALALLPLPWLVLGLLAFVLVITTLIRPQITLYLIAFAIPFGSLYEVNLGGITVGATEGLVGLGIAAWLARTIALRQPWNKAPKLAIPMALFVLATLFSLVNARSLPFAAKEIVKWVETLAVMGFVALAVPPVERKWIVACLLLAGISQALLGAYQFFTQTGPVFFILRGRYMRAYGTFDQPNPYAGYLGLIAPIALSLALNLLERRPALRPLALLKRDWLYWFALVAFVLTSAAIGMSWSRGAWLGFAASTIVVNVLRSKGGAALFTAVLVVAAIAGLLAGTSILPEPILQRLTSFLPFIGIADLRAVEVTDDNYASIERLAHWQAAVDMWADHPWLGVGFGNYEAAYPDYALPKWPLALGHAHNYYLNIGAETGMLGLIAYLGLWGAALWQVWRSAHKAASPYQHALSLGALGMLVHITVHNMVDNLWVHNMYIHVAIVLGLVLSTSAYVPLSTLPILPILSGSKLD